MCIITLDLNILMRLDDMLVQNRPLISIISYNRCKRFQERGEGMYTFIISIILLVIGYFTYGKYIEKCSELKKSGQRLLMSIRTALIICR